jgi:hypothetical protein
MESLSMWKERDGLKDAVMGPVIVGGEGPPSSPAGVEGW